MVGAIDRHGDCNINTASDFIAQYTTRQAYKYADALPDQNTEPASSSTPGKAPFLLTLYSVAKACLDGNYTLSSNHLVGTPVIDQQILSHLEHRALRKDYVCIEEFRDVLRRAAALLCRTKADQCSIVQHLVGIPFSIFTKQSIKLGIALWLGVINENPRMEPRILAEIAQSWEITVRKKAGVFSDKLRYV